MGKSAGWYELFNELIERGHGTKEKILESYTLDDVENFFAEIDKKSARDRALFIDGVAIGSQGTGKTIKKAVRDLLKSRPRVQSKWAPHAPQTPASDQIEYLSLDEMSTAESATLLAELAQMDRARAEAFAGN